MRILILHHNKFERMAYDVGIDHDVHDVVYAGTQDYISNIPPNVRCETFTWDAASPVEGQLRSWMARQAPFERIIARHEKLITPAANLRAEFDIPGMKPAQAVNFRDKVAMKKTLERVGVRVPRFLRADEVNQVGPWQGRTIVKPRTEAGSQGVKLFDTYQDAYAFVESQRLQPAAFGKFGEQYEVEEYLEGPIWHVDGFLFEGQAVVVQPSRYVGTPLGFEEGSPLGSVQFAHPELEEWSVDCLRALGGETLTFHLEAIMTESGPAFLEVAARCGGSHIIDTIEYKHGIYLHTIDMASDVDGKLATRFVRRKPAPMSYGFFLYPGRKYAGAPITVRVSDELLNDPHMVTYTLRPPDIPTVTTHSYRPEDLPFSGVVAGEDSDALAAWLRNLFDDVTITPSELLEGIR